MCVVACLPAAHTQKCLAFWEEILRIHLLILNSRCGQSKTTIFKHLNTVLMGFLLHLIL